MQWPSSHESNNSTCRTYGLTSQHDDDDSEPTFLHSEEDGSVQHSSKHHLRCLIRSHFAQEPFPVRNVHGVFPVHERFWFCLVQVWHVRVNGTDVPVSPLPASSSNMGSPNGSLPDLEGTGYRASTMEEKINEILVQIAKLPLLMQSVSRFENCVQTLSQTVASYDAKMTNIEQIC